MAISIIQSSFAAGELSENLFARVDLDKYHTGAALMQNFFVDYRGGASTRPGTMLVDLAKGQTYRARLLPFIFSQSQSYVIELGDLYARFYTNGAQLLNSPSRPITTITKANPAVVQANGHGFTTGDYGFITGVDGMTEVDGQTYVLTVVDANHVSLADIYGNPINSTFFSTYTTGGTIATVYEIVTPWAAADLPLLKFVQSADVMTLTHPLYVPYDISRTGPGTFTLTAITIGPSLPATTLGAATPNNTGDLLYQYVVCAATAAGERGTPSAVFSADSKALNPTPATGAPINIEITYAPVAGADHYDIFKSGPTYNLSPPPTYFGYVGSTTDTAWTDDNIAPDYNNAPPTFTNPFSGGKNPGCVTYYQQRRVFANIALSSPEEMDFSRVGAYANFDVSGLTPIDSDAIQIAIASRQVNEIRAMVPTANSLVTLTSGGAFQVSGGTNTNAITPTNIVALPQASTGANDLPPITVNNSILFVQNKGAIVRDLAYNFYTQSFTGFDRSALANHLFFGHQLLEWAWAEEPFKLIWAVREDGVLLSLTYVPEQEVYGWSQHNTNGQFESVCSVPEGEEDAVYFIVQRPGANGVPVQYIERMASRFIPRVEDVWSVDCGVATVLTRPNFGLKVTVAGPVVTLKALTGTPFDSTWIGQVVWFDVGGQLLITAQTSSTLTCALAADEPLGNLYPNSIPPAYWNILAGAWEVGPLVTKLTGLEHLAGMIVACVADGQSVGPLAVSDTGSITLPVPACKVVAGLPFTAKLQTLDLDTGDPTIQGKFKMGPVCTLRLDTTRGLRIGTTFDAMVELKYNNAANFTPPLPLFSGDLRTVMPNGWNKQGRTSVQQDYPFPATVLGIIPEVTLGSTQT